MNKPQPVAHSHDDIIYPGAIPFVLAHLACFAVIWTGANPIDIWMAVSLYWIRIWGITAGYHRYFSHKTYSTSRWFQAFLAFVGGSSAQKGALWWASTHRIHHKYSDTIYDVHSPRQHGFWFAHFGWIFTKQTQERDYSNIKDLTKYPELVWLDKHQYMPAVVVAIATYLIGGWSGLVVGFFISTVATWHGTFMINSLAHVHGKQRFVTGDDSRNNWLLALLTLGEGWHNNHHYYQSCARNGFRWYEIDITYYSILLLEKLGIVWDVKQPSPEVLRGDRRLPKPIADRAKEIYDALSETVGSAALKGKEALNTATSRWDEFSELGKASVQLAMQDLSHRFDEAAESAAQKTREVVQHASEAVDQAAEKAKAAIEDAAEALDPNKPAYEN